jgi:hypothetical protein
VTAFLIAILAQSVVCAAVAAPFRSGTAAGVTLGSGVIGTARRRRAGVLVI